MSLKTAFIIMLKNYILANKSIGKFYSIKHPNSKYKLEDLLDDIMFVLKTGIAWRDLKSTIKWQSVYFHFKRFVQFNIFKMFFNKLRRMYIKSFKCNILLIDSSFISNKYGKNIISRNKFFKNKKCNKVSIITDVNGLPLSVIINKGSIHDSQFFDKHFNDLSFLFNTNKCNFLLADKAYQSRYIRESLNCVKCSLIVPNKSNQKKKLLFDKQIYKKRIFVEHAFQKLKSYRRINLRYDSYISTYYAFVYLCSSYMLFCKI